MKKAAMLVLAVLMLFGAAALAQGRTFTDSIGREVIVDEEITRVAVSGPTAQMFVFALAPDKLAGISSEWDACAQALLDEKYIHLPVLGQLYGGKGSINLETLLSAAPQVVIDVGQPKDGIAEDLDALGEQTGIPFVHISADTDSMDKAFVRLGELLGMEEEADALAQTCRTVYERTVRLGESVEKRNLLYITGLEGLSVIAKDSYHSEVIDMLSNNLAVLDNPSSRGTGNEVDMEQILLWNPDVIVFAEGSVFASVADDPLWQDIAAVKNGEYYEAPVGPYNWMGFPPGAQRLLGMMWMGKLLYPEAADYDLYEEVAAYFDQFYHCELTREAYDALLANSIGRQAETK